MPLLLMVGVIAFINLLPSAAVEIPVVGNGGTAVSAQTNQPKVTGTRPPILQATILPSPTPTITPRPSISDKAVITLFGPPTASILPLDSPVIFYWEYSEVMAPGQEFLLVVRQDEAVLSTVTLGQPNFGDGYRAALNLGETAPAGIIEWLVSLQWQDISQPLLTSEIRSFTLLPEG